MKKFEMLNTICKDCELTSKEKLVAQYFVYKSNKVGSCYPSVATIAEECSVSRRTVQRATKKLVEKEYIIKVERFKLGKQTSNLYSFNILLLEDTESTCVEEVKSNTDTQETEMEVIELSELLQFKECKEPVPEEFVQEDRYIDLDDLAASEQCEDDYIEHVWEDGQKQYKQEVVEDSKILQERRIKKKIFFSVTSLNWTLNMIQNQCTECIAGNEKSQIVYILIIIINDSKAFRKIMGAFFPP